MELPIVQNDMETLSNRQSVGLKAEPRNGSRYDSLMLLIASIFFMIGNQLWVVMHMYWIDPYFSTASLLVMMYWLRTRERNYSNVDHNLLFFSCVLLCCFCISTKTWVPFSGIFRWCSTPTNADCMDIIRVVLMLRGLFSSKQPFSYLFAINLLIMIIDENDCTAARTAGCNKPYGHYLDHFIMDPIMNVYALVLSHYAYPELDPLWWAIVIRNNCKETMSVKYFMCIPFWGWGSPMYSLTVVAFVRLWCDGFKRMQAIDHTNVLKVERKHDKRKGQHNNPCHCAHVKYWIGRIAWFVILTAPLINPLDTAYTWGGGQTGYLGGCRISLKTISEDFHLLSRADPYRMAHFKLRNMTSV